MCGSVYSTQYWYIHLLQRNVMWARGSDVFKFILCSTLITFITHNIVWACGSVILIYIYYNTILCEHVEVLFQYTFITTQYCVSTSKCYFNIHLLQHNIVWARGRVILVHINCNTILMWACGSVILIYNYITMCEHVEVLF